MQHSDQDQFSKMKIQDIADFDHAGQLPCYLLFYCGLQIQNQKVDSLSMRGMAGGYMFLSV